MASDPPTTPSFNEAIETQAPANWTGEQEYFFIDLMLQKVVAKGGNKHTGTFSKDEWKDVRIMFYNKFQKKYALKQFKNKFFSLKERYNIFKNLVECSTTTGLGWDPVLKTVTANDEWWEKYLKTNPKAKRFRLAGCPEFEQLAIIFGDTITIGILQLQASSNHDFNSKDGEDNEDEQIDENVPLALLEGIPTPLERASSPSRGVDRTSRSRSRTSTSTRCGKRDNKTTELSDALHRIAEVWQKRIECRTKYSISECMEILDAYGSELSETTYIRALKVLQGKGWREVFLRMTKERRKMWLLSVERGDI